MVLKERKTFKENMKACEYARQDHKIGGGVYKTEFSV